MKISENGVRSSIGEGQESVQLIDKSQYPPAVSPNGQLIASFYTHGDLRGLAVIPTVGGEPVKTFDVLPSPSDPENGFSQVIHWTADGGGGLLHGSPEGRV